MAAEVDITESDVKSVAEGQRAVVTVAAMPERTWMGRVERVSTMATSRNRFGPDVRVYETVIRLDGDVADLKPGMSTTAEVYVAELAGVLTVPIQAVTTYGDGRAVWVAGPEGLALHEVRTGRFSEAKVEIRAGLSEGDRVLLAPPDAAPADVPFVALSS